MSNPELSENNSESTTKDIKQITPPKEDPNSGMGIVVLNIFDRS